MNSLYIFRPHGHGEQTFGVIAGNLTEAKCFVIDEIRDDKLNWYHLVKISDIENSEIDNDENYYQVEVYQYGQVFNNDND